MSQLGAVLVNELEKLWYRRRLLIGLVTVGVVGLGLALDLALPQQADWKAQTRVQVAHLRQAQEQLKEAPPGVPASIQASLHNALDQQLAAQTYLLDHDIPPSNWYPAGRAVSTVLTTGFGFFLLLFGWLAAESIAQERSDRTLGLLLSQPVSRSTVIAGKMLALLLVAAGILLLAMLPVYVIAGLQHGGWADFNGQVMVLNDASKGVSPQNIAILPTWFYFLVAWGLSLAAVLTAQALGLLVSTLSRGPGLAIGSTLGALLLIQPLAAVLKLQLNDPVWLRLTFFPYLNPTTELTGQPNVGFGYSAAGLTLVALVLWSGLLFSVAALTFSRRSETA